MINVNTDGVFKFLDTAIDQLFDTPEEKAAAKVKLMNAESEGRINELNARLGAILAEANSADPWTSRARPAFLYVVYIFLLSALPMGVLFWLEPTAADDVVAGVKLWLEAIPEEMWTLFGVGYLGYAGARSIDKWKGGAK
jgi:hypothetical protein